ncbi:hypothetical protein TVAG_433510 [Trichomonas vaginalis G3]|uniref:RRM domain-containing protein n=1 Tax=Trichomonas vaginalis (strain ATCC PRA-98 / G3) TaxID=412133 RepID=A2FJH2_TRIV3|nr:RRM1 RBM26 like domain-containing protein [Trichomonas vaginalis G3]EAX94942.1 hypothetical protein TVAG_433510 [Trichomonas vaginalis G3]KAI5544722.1 RRM1 RBM26 like domain-containing protein [Trichomonas vaginalis G3]|eukprot:XP_001307872.1 hypothetical protein [Trichomonas vaginalis G3]
MAPPPKQDKPCDTLFVYNIPENKNKILLLFKHFKHYGHIKSIWCNQKVATISYSTVEEATKAFHSPEAYENNRFVMIKYHRNPAESESHLADAADMDFVRKVAGEVKAEIEKTQKKEEEERAQLIAQQKIRNLTTEINNSKQIIAQCENIAMDLFKEKDETQDAEKQTEIDGKIQETIKIMNDAKKKIEELEKEQADLKNKLSQVQPAQSQQQA